jgi:hypothetical protein
MSLIVFPHNHVGFLIPNVTVFGEGVFNELIKFKSHHTGGARPNLTEQLSL